MRFTSTSPRSSRRPSPLDLLYLNGRDLRKLPLIERKAHLKKIIGDTDMPARSG
jgi:ATP-dependent DNA ligase